MRRTTTRRALAGAAILLITAALSAPAVAGICTPFRRGDANADGHLNVSDALTILSLLFLGLDGPEPPCLDAADAEDSGQIDVTDAVYILNFLFLGGGPPPPPGPATCGVDRTFDGPGCDAYPPCAVPVEALDVSGFERFEFAQHPGFGFCPPLGEVFDAAIERSGDGTYSLELRILEEGQAGDPDCIEGFISDGEVACAVPRNVANRDLTGAEVEAMRALFGAVSVLRAPDPICECIAIDPCLIPSFSWDGDVFNEFVCSGQRITDADADAIRQWLGSLGGP